METQLFDGAGTAAALAMLAEGLAALAREQPGLALVGVRRGGAVLARRLAQRLSLPVGEVDIGLYRDDAFSARAQPLVGPSEIAFDVAGRPIALVDDVLYTGRTVRAAIDAVMDYGRPRRVWLFVLVDRGGRELPIQADLAGARVECGPGEQIDVRLVELGAAADAVVRVSR